MAITFDPDPRQILRKPGDLPARLTSRPQRDALLRSAGADHVEWLNVTPALLELSPSEFLLPLIQRLKISAIVEGPDFRFGRNREGDIRTLRDIAQSTGVRVEVVEPVEVALSDHHVVPARSTVARWLIGHGRMYDATIVLGRPYSVHGTVVRGDRRGRTIGYPTVNIQTTHMIPADGVYAGCATLPDGRRIPAAISVGTKPTFGRHERALEAFLLEHDPNVDEAARRVFRKEAWREVSGLNEYGWSIELEIASFLRDQVRFQSLHDLLDQMDRDCRTVIETLGNRSECISRPAMLETSA